jgi:hypothetical protein
LAIKTLSGFAFGLLNLGPSFCNVFVTATLGANLIFTAINMLTGDPSGFFGGIEFQNLCIIILAFLGHFVQIKLGIHEHKDDEFGRT